MAQKYKIAENRMFDAGGHDFLFLTADNAIFEMDAETRTILKHLIHAGEQSRQEIFSHIDGSDEEKKDLFESFIHRKILVNANGRKSAERQKSVQGVIPLKTLVLHVTDACNLGCHYCYSCHPISIGKNHPKNSPMTVETAQNAVDFLFAHCGNLEKVILVFFGGEPLLNFDLIAFVVKYARSKALEKGKQIDFAITTNGTLLTDKIIRFLHENRIGVTVSIDGFEEIHDRFRRFPDGTPSYQIILPKIKNLLAQAQKKPVVARVTVTRDSNDLPKILEHLLDMGFAEAGFAPVTTTDPCYQLSADEMNNLLSQFRTLSDMFVAYALQNKFLGFTNLVDLLVVLHEGEVKNYPCGAGLGLFSVDAEGRLYLCQRLFGEDQFCMGNIFIGFDQDKIDTFRTQAEISQKQACKRCWTRVICAGGCYHEALLRQGNLSDPNLHYCEWIKNWIQIGLNVYGRIASEFPEYLDKLSMLRGHTL